ncbi:MAG: ferritin-like domain-containing protein [Alphaproteobacteria bacterium]|nr:ferritin-like domain-containing protein [Alphaproteobacteria bacterium]
MTRNSFELRLLALMGVVGCSTPEIPAQPHAQRPEGPVPEHPAEAIVAAGQLMVLEAPHEWGTAKVQLEGLPSDGTRVFVLASTRRGAGRVESVPTGLHNPVVVGLAGGEEKIVEGPHGLAAEVGRPVYLQAVAVDGSWRTEVVASQMQRLDTVCGAGVMAYEFPEGHLDGGNVVACNTVFVPGMCPTLDEVGPGRPILEAAGANVNDYVVSGGCAEPNAVSACCYAFSATAVNDSGLFDSGWPGDSGPWGGGGGGGWMGRPFRVDDAVRVAGVHTGDAVEALPCPDAVRERVAGAWARMALEEHSAIAAFARFSLELMSLGAPLDLLEACAAAQLDEVRHARVAFDLASRLAGQRVEPTAMPMGGALDGRDLRAITLDVVREGCLNETISTLVVLEARDAAIDPQIRAALSDIADDEARHAELAWRFVRWVLAQPGTESLKAEVLAILQGFEPGEVPPESADADVLAAFGVLTPHRRAKVGVRAASMIARLTDALA